MQSYHGGQYYPHPQYPPQRQQPQPGTYLTGFTASYPHFVQPQPGHPQQAAVPQAYQAFPSTYQTREQYETYPVVPQHSRSSKHHRSQSLAVPNPAAVPLKSALKRRPHERSGSMANPLPTSQPINNLSMSRTSSRAPSEQRDRASSTTRRRADSIPYMHEHLFMTFPGSNEVKLENADLHTVDELRQNFLLAWPAGVAEEGISRHEPTWRAQFNGVPWASSGQDAIIARRMIVSLYSVLASQGYSYLSTASTSNPPARFIFARSAPEQIPYFFTISISQSGGKLSILDAPPQLPENMNHALRGAFPRQIMADRATEDGLYVIELRKSGSAWESDKTRFTTFVLGFLNSSGFKLDGSIPMGKAGHLGFGSRKELWIFKAVQSRRPGSSHSRHREDSFNSYRDREDSTHGHSSHGHNSTHDRDDR